MIAEANKKNEEMKRDPDIDSVISRFVRAVIRFAAFIFVMNNAIIQLDIQSSIFFTFNILRMFMLLTLLSPAAITVATATASGISQVLASGNSPPRFFIMYLTCV